MKRQILTLILIVLPCASLAQPTLEQGYDAYESGEVATAIRIWRALGESGNATAQVNLGQLYRLGHNIAADDREAVKWYSLAARQGSEVAKYNLMLMHAQGRASRGDLDLAFARPMNSAEEKVAEPQNLQTQGDKTAEAGVKATTILPNEPGTIPDDNWFNQLQAPQYLVQIVSSPHRKILQRYRANKVAQFSTQILRTTKNGSDNYLLLLGPFASRQLAKETISGLPESVKADQPWVRPVSSVQQIAVPERMGDTDEDDWFRGLPTPQYVLQLASSPHRKSLRNYSDKHLDSTAFQPQVVGTTRKGRDHYLLLLGPFESRKQARAAIFTLPKELQSKKPYARTAYSVQRVLMDED